MRVGLGSERKAKVELFQTERPSTETARVCLVEDGKYGHKEGQKLERDLLPLLSRTKWPEYLLWVCSGQLGRP